MPAWLAQVLAVVIAAPIATLLAYLPSVDGDLDENARPTKAGDGLHLHHRYRAVSRRCSRSARSTASATRRRARRSSAFALERSTLEKEALDARLTLLQAQIEPHFLFNTLANVQALVESGSPQAAPVLKSLIAYLRAAMPQLHAERLDPGRRDRPGRAPISS